VHVHQRVSGGGTSMHEQRCQVCVVRHWALQKWRRLLNKQLHVLGRHRSHGHRLP
jgi:hypothetical protein